MRIKYSRSRYSRQNVEGGVDVKRLCLPTCFVLQEIEICPDQTREVGMNLRSDWCGGQYILMYIEKDSSSRRF